MSAQVSGRFFVRRGCGEPSENYKIGVHKILWFSGRCMFSTCFPGIGRIAPHPGPQAEEEIRQG